MAAGAKLRGAEPPMLRRADYRPPAWLVPEMALDLDIAPDRVRVRTRMRVTRNGSHGEPLRLDGEGLKLVSLTVDGRPASHKLDKQGVTIRIAGAAAIVETVVEFAAGKEQRGLFALNGLLCTQCEPQGFRRITYFPDRPDVLTRMSTRIEADADSFPALLANGNPAGGGPLEGGRHWAIWDDPIPKPCYLFALVAGALAPNRSRFATRSGRQVDLAIWTREADLPRTAHAMASLRRAMAWDEQAFGREYDLDSFNIVGVRGYAFGAVEAKGLNLFDTSLLLADPDTATDADLAAIASLVGHEYFHNWSGNRATIRDWFELTLKEGLTVFRDQQFCASLGSAAVKRIQDVRALRAAQFRLAPDLRPPRPDDCRSVGELYGASAYAQGAELVRMLEVLVGPQGFRGGMDLFFARHDGGAAACEDLIQAMEEAGGRSLAGFSRWYDRAAGPRVRASLAHDRETATAVVTLAQEGPIPAPIPLRTALFGADGKLAERLLVLEGESGQFAFQGIVEPPILSINRGFSAPIASHAPRTPEQLALLATRDDDGFARWDAMQELMLACLIGGSTEHALIVDAVRAALDDPCLDMGFVAELAVLPAHATLVERTAPADPAALHAAWAALRGEVAQRLADRWRETYVASSAGESPGGRALRSVALDHLLAAAAPDAGELALRQIETGPTMTDRLGALRALANSDAPERIEGLAMFHRAWRHDPVTLDRWFSAQALSLREDTIEIAPRLLAHSDFTLAHPTRLDAIAAAFAANVPAFHHPSGRGYRFLADVVLAADRVNPEAAAALARPLGRGELFAARHALSMRQELDRIAATSGISEALRRRVSMAL